MYLVLVNVQCVERFSEILLEDRVIAELQLRSLTEGMLQQFFATPIVDEVDIHCLPEAAEGSRLFSIRIVARCTSALDPLPLHKLLGMELTLEDSISCALLQLIGGRVDVEDVSIGDYHGQKNAWG